MKKSLVAAVILSVFAVSGFAQSASATTPAEAGAKLVAERDAAWLAAHPGAAESKEPMAGQNAKHVKATKPVKQAKQKVKKAGTSDAKAVKP
jgi:L-fucose isomerase-like protein